jgi:hypothetical protein
LSEKKGLNSAYFLLSRCPEVWRGAATAITSSIIVIKSFDLIYYRLVWWLSWSPGLHCCFLIAALVFGLWAFQASGTLNQQVAILF